MPAVAAEYLRHVAPSAATFAGPSDVTCETGALDANEVVDFAIDPSLELADAVLTAVVMGAVGAVVVDAGVVCIMSPLGRTVVPGVADAAGVVVAA
jgi:hypothetical protein